MIGEDLAVVIVLVTFMLTTGGVVLLRPVTRRLGELLEVLIQEKRSAVSSRARAELSPALEQLEARLSAVEERLHFTEALLSAPGGRRAGHPAPEAKPAIAASDRE